MLVNHEGEEDLKIVKELQRQVASATTVVAGGGAMYLKGIFSEAEFVVASRYHALVSAMTQAVPVIGMGWSHKYEELFLDFGISDYLVEVDDDGANIIDAIKLFVDDKQRDNVALSIERAAVQYKEHAKCMWTEIRDLMANQ